MGKLIAAAMVAVATVQLAAPAMARDFFNRTTGFASTPTFKRTELGLQRSPIRFGQLALVSEQRLDGGGV